MPEQQSEALVIGSGFGGAVAALRLAEAGYEVTVLERGKRWTGPTPFATTDAPDGRAAWLSTHTVDPLHPPTSIKRHAGLLDRHEGQGMAVLTAAGVGGGSLAFTGALVQLEHAQMQRLFPWFGAEDLAHLQQCSERVRPLIQPSPVPLDLLADTHFEQARLFAQCIQQAGLVPEYAEMALDWDIVRQELRGERVPAYIVGNSWYGLNSGAKKSLDTNYLAQAEATGRVDIRPLHVVQSIAKSDDADFVVSGIEIDEEGNRIRPFTVTSRLVFLAAGSVGTSALLVRAKAVQTLPRLRSNPAVGKGWGNNGDVIGLHQGHPHRATVPQVAAGAGIVHQQKQGLVRLMGDAINGSAPEALLTLAMVLLANGFPNRGAFVYDAGTDQVQLQWDQAASQHLQDIARHSYHVFDRGSCAAHHASSPSLAQTSMTAHPLGGMVLGAACDPHDGHVRGYENLYVVDGSLLPGHAGGVPPALTIAALAEYLLAHILHKRRC